MTENQRIWLEEIIDEHRVAANNDRLWAKGADASWKAQMHKNNAEEHEGFVDMLQTLLKNERNKQ